MTTGSAARRYAKALFEIGEEKGTLLGLIRQVQSAADAWSQSADLREAMTNPLLKREVRRQILGEIVHNLGISDVGKSFIHLLSDKSRLAELPGIARELNRLSDLKHNRIRAEISGATPVSEVVVTKLKFVLEKLTGKMVLLSTSSDPSLIGGMVTRVGNLMYDGSIKGQLKSMKENMLGHA
jgi:F-type H+-transporting ATPase subunit delta